MFGIVIEGEPYVCKRVDYRTFLWMNITQSKYTILDAGEYVLVDRHFNCFFMTAPQMDAAIARDFRGFKLPVNPKRAKDITDVD